MTKETTTACTTEESTVSSIYHEKRAAATEESKPNNDSDGNAEFTIQMCILPGQPYTSLLDATRSTAPAPLPCVK